MVKNPTAHPPENAPEQSAGSAPQRKPVGRKLKTLGASVTPAEYAEMVALAAAADRTLAYLGGLAISEFLARRRSVPVPGCASCAPAPSAGEGNTP